MAKKEKMNVAVFGGSFDPVHSAHIEIVKNLNEAFDKVIIMPSFISPFKTRGAAADSKHRMAMLENAFGDFAGVEISDTEISKNDISYTIDTIRKVASKNKGAGLYFVIGSDNLKKLDKWRDFKELKKLTSFYVVKRKNFRPDKALLAKLKKKGVEIEFADFTMPDVSSSLARVAAAFNDSSLLGEKNFEYIKANKLYTDYDGIVAAFDKFNLKEERRAHTFRAAEAGIALAKRNDVDVVKTIKTILLHDIGKYADEEIMKNNGLTLDAKARSLPPEIMHAYVSGVIAKKYFSIKESSVIKAIESHTTGSLKMDKLAKIVFLADYIENGRKFDNLESIRRECEISLDLGMEAALANSIEYLTAEGKEIYYPTLEVYEKFKKTNELKLEKEAEKLAKKAEKDALKAASLNKSPSAAAPKAFVKAKNLEPYDLAYTIAQLIDDKKGRDIVLVDLENKTIIADYFVIASVMSTTAVRALTDHIDEALSKNYGIEPLRRDIDPSWSAVDYGSVIVHIQLDETRKFYDLQRLWSDGTNVKHFGAKK